ncbi:MAG: hemin ABC transporter substrate-binding protein [Rhodomicrobiaceae bacterium]
MRCRFSAALIVALFWSVAALLPALAAQDGPKRIITLGGDITEIVYLLGAADRLVGRDATSTFPPETAALADVGYFRQLGAEGVLSLKPDLILASASAGPEEVFHQLQSAGVRIEKMADAYSPEGLLEKVGRIAQLLDVPEKGAALAAKLSREIAAAKSAVAAMKDRPTVLFIINSGGGAPMAAGRRTAADALMALAGGENVFASHTGYKTVSLEAAAAASPVAIALMEHTLETMGGVEGVVQNPALRLTAAAKTRRIVARDGTYLLGFGPRLPHAIIDFAYAIRGKEQS